MIEENEIINMKTQCMERAIDHCTQQAQGDKPLLLVSGDMSGIQPFLYQIVSSKAAKNLKGRSCYIDLLGKAVVESLLRVLALNRNHVVCESGGTFVLLAPNTDDTIAALDNAVRFIEKKIFETHGTALSVAIGSVAISVDEARGGTTTLAQRWSEVFAKREIKKNAKCASVIVAQGGYERSFEPSPVTGDQTDAITGEDIADGGVPFGKDKDKALYVSRINNEIFKLGEALRNGCELDKNGKDFTIEPAGLGVPFSFKKNKEAPRVETFEEMCDNDGMERLGVLRMDVDNLGSKFQEYARTQSLAAYSALSHELDNFFKGDVSKMCDKHECYLLYGGGDDLFVVGEWRKVIELAAEIQSQFKKWAAQRKGDWSLSAGVAIVKAKYPIIEGAQESGEEEENAKTHECAGSLKNSISLMGTPLNWDKEFEPVKDLKDKMVKMLLDSESLPKSFLNKVMMHASKAAIKNHKVTDVSIYWHLSYDIKRAKERAKDEAVLDLLNQCQEEICTPKGKLGGESITTLYHPLELWALACRWAELEFRSIKENQ